MVRLFVVRHGNTFGPGDVLRRIGGRTDLPLVPSGREQARALGRHFKDGGIVFDTCLSGPLLRTRETAGLIFDTAGHTCPIIIAEALREIDHGPDEGRTEAEVIARIGQPALDAWEREAIIPDGWLVDADARRAAWAELLAQVRGTQLIVTSNGAARFAMPDAGKLRTGAYGEIVVTADRAARVVAWDVRP